MSTITTSKGNVTLLPPATLRDMNPQALAEYLSQIEGAKQALEVDINVSQSRLEDLKTKLSEVQATAQREFGVNTVEALSKIRDDLLGQIDQALNPPPEEAAPQAAPSQPVL